MRDEVTPVEQRDFLLAAAAWQDSLLQSYRGLHVSMQGFLVASSSTVLAVQLTSAIQGQPSNALATAVFNVLFTLLVGFLFWLQRRTALEFHDVVNSRAEDISHWHREVVLAENNLSPELRAFTYFKMWQHAHRADVKHLLPRFLPEDGVSESSTHELIGKGIGHTRRVLDINLFIRIHKLFYVILFVSIGITGWFIYLYYLSM